MDGRAERAAESFISSSHYMKSPMLSGSSGSFGRASTIGIKGSATVYAFTIYAAGRGVYCDEFSTVTDASQRMPAAIPPTIVRARENADLTWGFIA